MPDRNSCSLLFQVGDNMLIVHVLGLMCFPSLNHKVNVGVTHSPHRARLNWGQGEGLFSHRECNAGIK